MAPDRISWRPRRARTAAEEADHGNPAHRDHHGDPPAGSVEPATVAIPGSTVPVSPAGGPRGVRPDHGGGLAFVERCAGRSPSGARRFPDSPRPPQTHGEPQRRRRRSADDGQPVLFHAPTDTSGGLSRLFDRRVPAPAPPGDRPRSTIPRPGPRSGDPFGHASRGPLRVAETWHLA